MWNVDLHSRLGMSHQLASAYHAKLISPTESVTPITIDGLPMLKLQASPIERDEAPRCH